MREKGSTGKFAGSWRSAVKINFQIRTWSQGVERALAEVAVRIRARHSLPDWVTAAGQLLQNILSDIEQNAKTLFGHMTTAETGRFFRSLSTISAGQVELGPEPAVIRRSLVPVWIVGFFALENSCAAENSEDPQRKISSESTSSEKS